MLLRGASVGGNGSPRSRNSSAHSSPSESRRGSGSLSSLNRTPNHNNTEGGESGKLAPPVLDLSQLPPYVPGPVTPELYASAMHGQPPPPTLFTMNRELSTSSNDGASNSRRSSAASSPRSGIQ
jgi:hypothetical protein